MIFESLRRSSGYVFGALVFKLDFCSRNLSRCPQIHLTQKPYMREKKGVPGWVVCVVPIQRPPCCHSVALGHWHLSPGPPGILWQMAFPRGAGPEKTGSFLADQDGFSVIHRGARSRT